MSVFTMFLQFIVRAYDLGTPRLEDTITIHVHVWDIDDHPPTFDRELYPPPHPLSVLEEVDDAYIGNVSLATDPDVGNNSIICYYLIGASHII